jgi:hypothetical protein
LRPRYKTGLCPSLSATHGCPSLQAHPQCLQLTHHTLNHISTQYLSENVFHGGVVPLCGSAAQTGTRGRRTALHSIRNQRLTRNHLEITAHGAHPKTTGGLLMSGRRPNWDSGEPDLWSNGSVFMGPRDPISIDPSPHIPLQQTTATANCDDIDPYACTPQTSIPW